MLRRAVLVMVVLALIVGAAAFDYLDLGDTFRYQWYSRAQFPKAVSKRFVAECPSIDYGQNIPV